MLSLFHDTRTQMSIENENFSHIFFMFTLRFITEACIEQHILLKTIKFMDLLHFVHFLYSRFFNGD